MRGLACTFLLLTLLPACARPGLCAGWGEEFQNPGNRHGTGVYWWWFGPAQTKPEIAREIQVMKEAGIGRVLIYPMYPVTPDDPAKGIRHIKYLSPEFIAILQYAVAEARRHGMDVSVPLGSGWPYGGPSVSAAESAQRLRMLVDKVEPGARPAAPALAADESAICRLLAPGDGSRVDLAKVRDVTAAESLPAVTGPHVLLTFVRSPTRMNVKRPALGGEGPVLDHLSRPALESYLRHTGTKLLPALAGGAVVHADSFEVYAQSWTEGFLAEFKKRRGYDLRLSLPALFVDCGADTADIRHDYWSAIGDLFLENHMRPLSEWVHKHGSTLQAESYGAPAIDMRGFEWIDHPMGESYDWKTFVASRWASSAAHQMSRRFVAAETWTWLQRPRYFATLEDLKRGADLQFLCGINRVVGHGYAYSPPEAGVPGWGYYASVMLNDNNPWWPHFRLLADYIRRASYALSLGKPRADIALYLPEDDALAEQSLDSGPNRYKSTMNLYFAAKDRLSGKKHGEFGLPGAMAAETPVIASMLDAGFAFDGIDRAILRPGLRVDQGRMEVGDASYRIVVLPNLTGISLEMLERIAKFCRSGGTVIATRRLPDRAYGMAGRDRRRQRVAELTGAMFVAGANNRLRRHAFGKGLAIFVPDEADGFRAVLSGLAPQVRVEGAQRDLYFVQRGDGAHEIYFLTNTLGVEREVEIGFRDGRGRASRWDPMSGEVQAVKPVDGGRLKLRLEAYGSTILSFDSTQPALPKDTAASPRETETVRPVTGPWTLAIGGETIRLDRLKSWTEFPRHRYFSGAATYETEVALSGPHPRAWLDLGTVREIAEVWINGERAGVNWRQPRRVEVSGRLRQGRNKIAIRVTNLLINRVLGQPDPDYSGLAAIQFPSPLEKKTFAEPFPSGLLGPVQLRFTGGTPARAGGENGQ